jgi:hypothetical protein
VVISTPRSGPERALFLSVDHDGSPLLALAGDTRFEVFHIRIRSSKITVGRVRTERGKLVRAPIVDPFGYSFVVEAADKTLRVKRRDALRPVDCGDDDDDVDNKRAPRADEPICSEGLLGKLF